MSMRAALPLTLLLAACRPAHDPESIRRALAKTPIDVAALQEAFHVEPNALTIHAPGAPAITLKPPSEPWVLENVSARPVWVSSSALTVNVDLEPFLSPSGYRGRRLGGRSVTTIPRPTFDPAEWILLYPGERIPLRFKTERWAPGDLELHAFVGDAGAGLVHAAREFNAKLRLASGGRKALATRSAATLLLPPLDWPGAPWHDTIAVDPLPLGDGRVELILAEAPERLFPLALEAFVVDAAENVVGHEELRNVSVVDDDSPSRRALYDLPFELPPGGYRLLIRAPNVGAYFLDGASHACDLPDDAASRWIPFTIP